MIFNVEVSKVKKGKETDTKFCSGSIANLCYQMWLNHGFSRGFNIEVIYIDNGMGLRVLTFQNTKHPLR